MKVKRYFLELKFKDCSNFKTNIPKNFEIEVDNKKNFQINKFFYRQIGIDHFWRDRLIWSDKEWNNYVKNKNLETWVLKNKDELVGFYELEHHLSSNEVELINMGVLKEYRGKKLGSNLLLHSINRAHSKKSKRIWVHTCSLDHKYALQNYKSKGFSIFRNEEVSFVA